MVITFVFSPRSIIECYWQNFKKSLNWIPPPTVHFWQPGGFLSSLCFSSNSMKKVLRARLRDCLGFRNWQMRETGGKRLSVKRQLHWKGLCHDTVGLRFFFHSTEPPHGSSIPWSSRFANTVYNASIACPIYKGGHTRRCRLSWPYLSVPCISWHNPREVTKDWRVDADRMCRSRGNRSMCFYRTIFLKHFT
jgi:hypothetical protein